MPPEEQAVLEGAPATPATPAQPPAPAQVAPKDIDEVADKYRAELEPAPKAETPPEETPPEEEVEPKKDEPKAETFDPAKYGLDDSYKACKGIEDALREVARRERVAQERHANAEKKIREQGEELGRLRHEAPKKETPAPTPAAESPKAWTAEERGKFHERFDEAPEETLGWLAEQITTPLVAKISALETSVTELQTENKALKGTVEHVQTAPATEKAVEAWGALVKDHPDAEALKADWTLHRVYESLNADLPEAKHNIAYGDIYEMAKLKTSDPAEFEALLPHMQRGYTLTEAREIVVALRTKAENAKERETREREEAKRRERLSSAGRGGSAPGARKVTAKSIDELAEQYRPTQP